MKLLFFVLGLMNMAIAQSVDTIEANVGFYLKANGEVMINKSQFANFDEKSNPRSYTRVSKDKNRKETFESIYVYVNKENKAVQVVSYDSKAQGASKVWSFENSELSSKTTCFGSGCKTLTKNLCEALREYFKAPQGNSDSMKESERIFKKSKECGVFYTNLYSNVIEPSMTDLSKREENNLMAVGNALMASSSLNAITAGKIILKDSNRGAKVIEEAYLAAYKADYALMSKVMRMAEGCWFFPESNESLNSTSVKTTTNIKAKKE